MTSHSGKRTVIVSDMHHRISGVSATIRALIPKLTQQYSVFFVARKAEGQVQNYSVRALVRLLIRWSADYAPIWHVRRNNEMLWGILLRRFVNRRLKLVFTSAAIRRHSAWPRFLISKMDAIIATSDKAATFVPNVWSTVPHGVDVARFEASDCCSKSFPWTSFSTVLAIVGRIRPEKGTDLFSEVICQLLPDNPDTAVVIVGKTTAKYQSFLSDLRQDWKEAGISERVFVLDEVAYSEMPDVYQTLDIVCCPARYEGFGLVPLEAMVSGTAVVASRTGAYPDLIRSGVNGELVDCGDSRQLKQSVEKLLNKPDLVEAYKNAGVSLVREKHDLKNEAAGITAVYERLWGES